MEKTTVRRGAFLCLFGRSFQSVVLGHELFCIGGGGKGQVVDGDIADVVFVFGPAFADVDVGTDSEAVNGLFGFGSPLAQGLRK